MVPLGPNNDEAVVHEWLIEVGQTVEVSEPIVSVETDKAVIEIESDVSGKVVRKLVEKGMSVRTGDPLAEIEA
jgi:pyruvate dehydrogenase E2 component (dihydrolipoamide acetyltransferase)